MAAQSKPTAAAADTTPPAAEPKSSVASSKVVAYVGTADVREIDAAAWRNAGIDDQGLVRWDKTNKHQVSIDDLTDAAVAYCDTVDDGFVIRDATI